MRRDRWCRTSPTRWCPTSIPWARPGTYSPAIPRRWSRRCPSGSRNSICERVGWVERQRYPSRAVPPGLSMGIAALRSTILPGRRRLTRQLFQHGQRLGHRAQPHLATPHIAEPLFAVDEPPVARGGGEMDEAHRLIGAATAGAGDAGDGDREIDRRMGERARRHRLGGLAAHRAMTFQDRGGNAEHRLLGRIRIGDEAAVDHVGRPRDLGERARDQAAGAGFRGCHRQPVGAAALQHLGGGAPEVLAEVSTEALAGHRGTVGSRMVAVAMAAIPSLRPMKPSFSLVVALTATRSSSTPAMAAMRARMASRCGPIRGASQMMVMSRWAMRPPRLRTRSAAKARKRSELAPFHCGSPGGKWEPMSPSASAPRMASTTAWSGASASE